MLLFENILWLKNMNISCSHKTAEMKVCEKTLFKNICIHKMYTLVWSTIIASESGVNNWNNCGVNTLPSALNSQYEYKHFGETEKI